jgi:surface polysaccharide O-acyltransferase-like enzyme
MNEKYNISSTKSDCTTCSAKGDRDRLFFLDLLKAVAIISVVSFHSIFVPFSTYKDSALALEVIFSPLRFCVPIFLTISFFLFERGLINRPHIHSWILKKKDWTFTRSLFILVWSSYFT